MIKEIVSNNVTFIIDEQDQVFELIDIVKLLDKENKNVLLNKKFNRLKIKIRGNYYDVEKFKYNNFNEVSTQQGVYILFFYDQDKVYIGSTKNIYRRLIQHRFELNKNKHINKDLQECYNANNKDLYCFTINCENILDIEQYFIDLFDKDKLINIFMSTRDWQKTEEYSSTMSKKLKKYYSLPDNKIKLNDIRNIRWTDDNQKVQASERMKQQWSDQELREKRINSINQSRLTDEYKNNHQLGMQAFRNDPEKVKAFQDKMRDKVWSNEDNKIKRAEALKKYWTTEEGIKDREFRKQKFQSPEHKEKQRLRNLNQCKPVSINGVEFSGVKQASRELNIPVSTLVRKIKSNDEKHSNYKLI